jgi:hypothetical protein
VGAPSVGPFSGSRTGRTLEGMADRIVMALCVALWLGVPWALQPSDGPETEWLGLERGWVCLDGDCRRPSEARALRGRPATTEPDEAWVFTYAREDGSVDHLAFVTAGGCERMRVEFDGSACRSLP